MAKRGTSGLSLVVAVNKPSGMTSHDVVNRCRSIFSERRVGHTGTLDPLASGVLPVCIGPATRLGTYLVTHDKRYRVRIAFGFETTTDDGEGEPTVRGTCGDDILNGEFAADYIAGLKGVHQQVPPAYSAIKINGRKAYELARAGSDVKLEAREIEIFDARLLERTYDEKQKTVQWVADFAVSKGTYIRALARDIGRQLGTPAHVSGLTRLSVGGLELADCVSLESLEALGTQAAIDPIRLLGYPVVFGDDYEKQIESGASFRPKNIEMFESSGMTHGFEACACMGSTMQPAGLPHDSQTVSIVVKNKLKAMYRFDEAERAFKPLCVFAIPVNRGL